MAQASSLDLNYLLFRQQVERSRAEAAASNAVREAHMQLARSYEQRIDAVTAESFAIARWIPACASERRPRPL